jgi:hypothetical protein
MYPNPAFDNIYFHVQKNQSYQVHIFDLNGKQLVQQEINEQLNSVPVSELQTGIYLVQIKNDDIQKTVRLVVE